MSGRTAWTKSSCKLASVQISPIESPAISPMPIGTGPSFMATLLPTQLQILSATSLAAIFSSTCWYTKFSTDDNNIAMMTAMFMVSANR